MQVTIKKWILQVLIGMFGALILMLFFHILDPPKKIVTVDVSGIIQRFIKQETNSKLPSDQLQKQVDVFGASLDNTLKQISRQKQLVLLPKEAVIAGATDITPMIESRIKASVK